MAKILLVDDEVKIRDLVRVYLEKDGYKVEEAADGKKALKVFGVEKIDLLILDWMLPEIDGLEVCKKIRQTSQVPILMLTAKGEEIDKILGLEFGADDYLVKPFSPRELVARVKALLRRSQNLAPEQETATIADLTINIPARKVLLKSQEIVMTPKEYELLLYLVQNKGQAISRERILEKVWGYNYFGDLRTVDTHIKNIREKIGNEYAAYLKTVWGVGYKFEV